MSTFEKKYIQWVQRTLNRELNADMVTSGTINSEYREAVETFQLINGLPVNGEVGSSDQNKMIKANHKAQGYVNWAQVALHEVGARERGTVTGIMDKETIDSIKSFQAYHKLNDDGWIGAKTEMELIDASGMLPPGHRKGSGPRPPKRFFYDNPKPKPFGLPADKAVTRIISANYYDAFYNRSTFSAASRRTRLCLLGKLKQRSGIDDRFPREMPIIYAYNGSSKYRTGSSVFESAREFLTRQVETWQPEKRLDPVAGRVLVNDLIKNIEAGLRAVERYSGKSMKPSAHASFAGLIAEVKKMVKERQDKTTSILSCFE